MLRGLALFLAVSACASQTLTTEYKPLLTYTKTDPQAVFVRGIPESDASCFYAVTFAGVTEIGTVAKPSGSVKTGTSSFLSGGSEVMNDVSLFPLSSTDHRVAASAETGLTVVTLRGSLPPAIASTTTQNLDATLSGAYAVANDFKYCYAAADNKLFIVDCSKGVASTATSFDEGFTATHLSIIRGGQSYLLACSASGDFRAYTLGNSVPERKYIAGFPYKIRQFGQCSDGTIYGMGNEYMVVSEFDYATGNLFSPLILVHYYSQSPPLELAVGEHYVALRFSASYEVYDTSHRTNPMQHVEYLPIKTMSFSKDALIVGTSTEIKLAEFQQKVAPVSTPMYSWVSVPNTVAPSTAVPDTLAPMTAEPTSAPDTAVPTPAPDTAVPTAIPTAVPTAEPTPSPPTTDAPTAVPTSVPTAEPTAVPTAEPTQAPQTATPTASPNDIPTAVPTDAPTLTGTTSVPTSAPTAEPTLLPNGTDAPTAVPTPEPATDEPMLMHDTAAPTDPPATLAPKTHPPETMIPETLPPRTLVPKTQPPQTHMQKSVAPATKPPVTEPPPTSPPQTATPTLPPTAIPETQPPPTVGPTAVPTRVPDTDSPTVTPKETQVPTQMPMHTQEPRAAHDTMMPAVTPSPVTTLSPDTTLVPDDTTPDTTPPPRVTVAPGTTESPDATPTPATTLAPDTTASPTMAPGTTDSPDVTLTPGDTVPPQTLPPTTFSPPLSEAPLPTEVSFDTTPVPVTLAPPSGPVQDQCKASVPEKPGVLLTLGQRLDHEAVKASLAGDMGVTCGCAGVRLDEKREGSFIGVDVGGVVGCPAESLVDDALVRTLRVLMRFTLSERCDQATLQTAQALSSSQIIAASDTANILSDSGDLPVYDEATRTVSVVVDGGNDRHTPRQLADDVEQIIYANTPKLQGLRLGKCDVAEVNVYPVGPSTRCRVEFAPTVNTPSSLNFNKTTIGGMLGVSPARILDVYTASTPFRFTYRDPLGESTADTLCARVTTYLGSATSLTVLSTTPSEPPRLVKYRLCQKERKDTVLIDRTQDLGNALGVAPSSIQNIEDVTVTSCHKVLDVTMFVYETDMAAVLAKSPFLVLTSESISHPSRVYKGKVIPTDTTHIPLSRSTLAIAAGVLDSSVMVHDNGEFAFESLVPVETSITSVADKLRASLTERYPNIRSLLLQEATREEAFLIHVCEAMQENPFMFGTSVPLCSSCPPVLSPVSASPRDGAPGAVVSAAAAANSSAPVPPSEDSSSTGMFVVCTMLGTTLLSVMAILSIGYFIKKKQAAMALRELCFDDSSSTNRPRGDSGKSSSTYAGGR